MSVEKYRIVKESVNYTIIPNQVLQGLKDYEALGLYVYLASLPPEWEFQKQHLREHGGIGINKLDNLLVKLKNHKLIEIVAVKNAKGQFEYFSICVKSGIDFIAEPQKTSPMKTMPMETIPMENSTYKYNKDKNNKKTNKSYCSSDDERSRNDQDWFDMFWQAYPKKVARAKALEIWVKKRLEAQGEEIAMDVLDRVRRHAQWQDKQYVPNPTTYLNQERWTDEIIEQGISANGQNTGRVSRTTQASNEAFIDAKRAWQREERERLDREEREHWERQERERCGFSFLA